MDEKRPLGISLLFASRAEILAAPAEECDAYFQIVEALVKRPEDFGFRHETSADLDADDAVDRGLHGMNQDWG